MSLISRKSSLDFRPQHTTSKLEINITVGKNLKCFKNNLNNRKQYIHINHEEKTNLLLVKCGVPQESLFF